MEGPWRTCLALARTEFACAVAALSEPVRQGLEAAGLLSDGVLDDLRVDGEDALRGLLREVVGAHHVRPCDVTAFLNLVEVSSSCAAKRRRIIARMPEESLSALFAIGRVQSSPHPSPRGSSVPPAPLGKASRWPTRLRREVALIDRPDALSQAEERDRARWAKEAIRIFVMDSLPIADLCSDAVDPEAILRRALGGRRGRTLRARVRTWRKVRSWLVSTGYPPFPHGDLGARNIVEYMGDLATGDCARSVPRTICSALLFFEVCGGVRKEERVAHHPLVQSAVKDLERELALGNARPKKKAPHYPLSIIVALEVSVVDVGLPVYKRVFCWWKLARVWGGMRFDDILHVKPSDVESSLQGLSFTIHSTKCTGAGKKVELVYAHVARDAFVFVKEWASVGYGLLQDIAGHVSRDYLLPLPSGDFHSVRNGPVLYADALNMTRAMLRELKSQYIAEDNCAGIATGGEVLLHADAATYWSEHGDRAQLVSWAACCGVDRPTMDALGRWKADGSAEYVRTAKKIVMDAQGVIARTIWDKRGASDLLGEEGIFQGLHRHLSCRGWSVEAIDAQLAKLRFFKGMTRVDPPLPSAAPVPPAENSVDSANFRELWRDLFGDVEPGDAGETGAGDGSGAKQAGVYANVQGPYVVSISTRTQNRCLHHLGKCWRKPGVDYQLFVDLGDQLDPSQYSSICRNCWPQGTAARSGAAAEDDLSDCGESSSSSSGPSEGELASG